MLSVIPILIAFNLVDVYIYKPKATGTGFSDTDHLLYVTGTVVLATIITSYTVGQIRGLWFALAILQGATQSRLLGKARTVIGLASVPEKARNFPITASFWLTGLITTGTVAGISPTTFPRK